MYPARLGAQKTSFIMPTKIGGVWAKIQRLGERCISTQGCKEVVVPLTKHRIVLAQLSSCKLVTPPWPENASIAGLNAIFDTKKC